MSGILVFDSGVGGLSIFDAIRARLPHAELHYACDNAGFPYGPRAPNELVARVDAVLTALIRAVAPDLIVIACNTASTVALPRLREHFSVPFVGVVPAIKPAATISKNKVLGLLATPGTVTRPYTDELIRQYASDCTVKRVGSSELVQIAEDFMRGVPAPVEKLQTILAPFFEAPAVDTIVLGCTHFPLLKEALTQAATTAVQWVDSGEAIAKRVAELLIEKGFSVARGKTSGKTAQLWLTSTNNSEALRPALHARHLKAARILNISQ